MKLNKLLERIDFDLCLEEKKELEKRAKEFVRLLKKKTNAEIFIGGSFAKGTLVRGEEYDIDVFVRFGDEGNLSERLEGVLKGIKKKRIHGSRDYFRIEKGKIVFEIVPVKKIKRICDAENVTDLSYFHVNYVKKKLKPERRKDIRLAKQFCKALGVYGAETFIGGFSGYSLECLIIYFDGFEKMIRKLMNVDKKLILDPAKFYKRKEDALIEINESKRQGPIVLVDPTWKERNVLAGLSLESFERFKEGCRKLIENPSAGMFEIKKIDISDLKKLRERENGEFVHVRLETDRQAGDIAGTKMKRFTKFLVRELGEYFEILKEEFVYAGGQEADLYLVVKSLKEVLKRGPLVEMKKSAGDFKKRNREIFEKGGRIWGREKVNFSAREFLSGIGKGRMVERGVSGMEVRKKG